MKEIINFSKKYGKDIKNFQGSGGNISFKNNGILYIKPSGYKVMDIFKKNILSEIDINIFNIDLELINSRNEENLSNIIKNNNKTCLNPSIETGFHLLLDKYVIHVHNVYINTILCMKGGEKTLNKLFGDTYLLIDYNSPGLGLFNSIKKEKKYSEVIFLKNHGVILHGNISFLDLYSKLDIIENKIKSELNLSDFKLDIESKKIKKHIFPDTIVMNNIEIYSAHKYLKNEIKKIGGKVNYLTKEQIDYIKNMNGEKYRKNLFYKNYIG